MTDLIHLLPDMVANQIAAGEVVQRPASAVKELLENAVDSGATNIKLIIKDAGKTLIQVVDNGCGMSERDARMCFERHATSKISSAGDLLAIHTLGFRGEALASIASIAQVEMRTRKAGDEVGTSVLIEGSTIREQSPVTTPEGTSILVKNLFYNVPARRNFLKSNTLELKYIIEEFFRVAFVNTAVSFSFYNNDKILYQIPASNLKQRVVNLLGQNYNERLVPVDQETGIVKIWGFIGKPEFAKKTRGEQYFFANGRFIKNAYLHHSVENAFRELISSESYPTYFIYLQVDPQTIDVNIHPTKTEVNFQDIKSIYAILHAAVRQSIGKFNITPALDFETEKSMNVPPLPPGAIVRQPEIKVNPDYNPFEEKPRQQEIRMIYKNRPESGQPWQPLFDPLKNIRFGNDNPDQSGVVQNILSNWDETDSHGSFESIQFKNRFIITQTKSGIVIIDQKNAHERILYEKFISILEKKQHSRQHQLIPIKIELSHEDSAVLMEYSSDLSAAGFDISDFGNNTVIINAIPAGVDNSDIPSVVERMIENLKEPADKSTKPHLRIARSMARSMAVSRNRKMQAEEIRAVVEQLFACQVPDITPDGKPVMTMLTFDELNRKFK